jgi:DNA-binding MarR family transcriptional regulator
MTSRKKRRDSRLVDGVAFRMLQAANLTARPFPADLGQPFRLTLASWRCMMALAARPDACGDDIARTTGLDKMSVSRGLRALQRQGRAHRTTDPTGAHRSLWQLSDVGWALFDELAPRALARERHILALLDANARRALKAGLDRVVERLLGDDA